MKTGIIPSLFLSISLFAACLMAGGCSSDKQKYTAAKAYGLQGPVKIVKDPSTKQTIVFNETGNIESLVMDYGESDSKVTYIYDTPSTYTDGYSKYRIECIGDTLRYINIGDDAYLPYENEYVFDDRGRVIEYGYYEGMMPVTIKYEYTGDSLLPDKETSSSFDEYGDWSTTTEYSYPDIDKHGNWTKRTGYYKSILNEYEEVQDMYGEWITKTTTTEDTGTVEETRTISYY